MNRRALLGLLAGLVLPAPAFALREVIVGNQPLTGYEPELLALLNVEERVYLEDGPLGGTVTAYFRGGPKAVNQALRRFAALPAAEREIILRPAPATPLSWDKKPIPYDWILYRPSDETGRRGRAVKEKATLTVYIPEPLPPAPADPQAARRWIADLGNEDFKTRERATRELTAQGPSVAALLREALRGPASAEARDRMERLLAGMSTTLRPDVLELPAEVPVVSLDDLLARSREKMTRKDPGARGNAAWELVNHRAPAEEVLPDIERMLKTETLRSAVAGAAWGAYHLGAAGRPLVPLLRAAMKSADKDIADMCGRAIDHIEKAPAEAVPEAEARKWATIRKDIKEFVARRAPK